MTSFTIRYARGEHDDVWRDLRALDPEALDGPLSADVDAVAHLMAVRARQNVETLAKRLTEAGFAARSNDDARIPRPMHLPPGPGALPLTAWLEGRFGPLPRTVRAWIREVGDVWLVGDHPAWPTSDAADPLVVEFEFGGVTEDPRGFYLDEHEAWLDEVEDRDPDDEAEPFQLPIAPDRLHKADISGGAPLGVLLAGPCADATLRTEHGDVGFVTYLNAAFAAGGFLDTSVSAPAGLREDLARGLLRL